MISSISRTARIKDWLDVTPGMITMPFRMYSSGVTPGVPIVNAMPGNLSEKFANKLLLTPSPTLNLSLPVITAFGLEWVTGNTRVLPAIVRIMRAALREAVACDLRPAKMMLPVPG
jgi:hypothetical protein